MEAKAERKTRARADFIVKWLIGLSNGQVAAVRGRRTTVSSSIPSAFICPSRLASGDINFFINMHQQGYDWCRNILRLLVFAYP